MGYRGVPSSRSRFVSIGLAYVVCSSVFFRLVTLLGAALHVSNWRGCKLLSFGVAVIAMAFVLSGISLLAWALLRHLPSGSKRSFLAQTSRGSGVWDQHLDG
jgi:hypothetical protein